MITSLDRHKYTLRDFVGKDEWVRICRKNSGLHFYIKVIGIYGGFDKEKGEHHDYVDYRSVLAALMDSSELLDPEDNYFEKIWTSTLDNIELISPLEILSEDEVTRMFT